jgi:excisionase family DNA binding protein
VEQNVFSKSKVLPGARSLLAQQVTRTLALQNELLADPLVDLRTAALALGGVSYVTISRLIRTGRIPAFRIGKHGKRKVRMSALRAFLAESERFQP